MKKALIIIAAVFLGLIAMAVVGSFLPDDEPVTTVPAPAAPTPMEPEEPFYTEAEQEIIDYCSSHINEMDDLITEVEVVLDSTDYAGIDELSSDILDLAKRYKRIETTYNRTNGGEYAGGKVERLETLWESVGNSVRIAIRGMAQCITDPDNVDVQRAARALVKAEERLPILRDEIDRLDSI